jgi:DNA-binding response OmpR family regulator
MEKQPVEHILLVEDSQVQGLRLKKVLEAEKLHVDWVYDGLDALSTLQNFQYDLIILDVELPVLDGYETCRRLKNNSETANIPVIILTRRNRLFDTLTGLDAGAIDYIPKDIFAEASLIGKIRQINKSNGQN